MKLSISDSDTLARHIVARIVEDMSVFFTRNTEDHDGGVDVSDDTLRRTIMTAIREVVRAR
jgi:hypothetical protein